MRDERQNNVENAPAQGADGTTSVETDRDPENGAEPPCVDIAGLSNRATTREATRERLINWLPPNVQHWIRGMIGSRDLTTLIKMLMDQGLTYAAVLLVARTG